MIMQPQKVSTGLTDVDNKEIFVGDILQDNRDKHYIVQEHSGHFLVKCIDTTHDDTPISLLALKMKNKVDCFKLM